MRRFVFVVLSVLAACSTEPVTPASDDASAPDAGSASADATVAVADVGLAADVGAIVLDAEVAVDATVAGDDASLPDAGDEVDAGQALDAAAETDAGTPAADGSTPSGDASTLGTRVRVLAGNLTSGDQQAYDEGEGIRIFQGLKPDIALIQEFNYGAGVDTDIRAFVDQAFGTEFTYYRESGVDDDLPNGIITRYPILASGEWDDPASINRDLAWARLDVPGPVDLWVVSLHLRTSNVGDRNIGATKVVENLKKVMGAGDYLVIGGDFNTGTRTEKCITTFSELVRTAAPWPVDQAGNGNTSAKRSSPLDWLLHNDALHPRLVPVQIGANQFPNGLVFDSRVYVPLSDVAPILQNDCKATNMQHMAVVKDFLF